MKTGNSDLMLERTGGKQRMEREKLHNNCRPSVQSMAIVGTTGIVQESCVGLGLCILCPDSHSYTG